MPSDTPRTPESPSQSSHLEFTKPQTSPKIPHSLPTPAHSINGSMSSITNDIVPEEVSNKRKREMDDQGDREQKKVHVDDGRLGIDDLHLDVGKKYMLCKTLITRAFPDVRQDLYAKFGLQEIAQSVARTLPDGSKGVKLRKTYKNHIKDHGLSGAFDSIKKEKENPQSLSFMMVSPAEEWDAQYTRGQEIESGLPASIKQMMSRAFTMARGPIPKAAWNSTILGEIAAPVAPEPVRPVQNGKVQQANIHGAVRAQKPDPLRPKRNVKKRTYGDSSYEGYGEGYVDDDTQEAGYSTGGDGDEKSRKKAKKSGQVPGGPGRHNSYGPGMVGA